MVEPNLQIINFDLTCNLVALFSVWHAPTLLVKTALPNASIAMSQKRVLPLCSMYVCRSLCGLRPSQLLSFSLTDSRHRYLMAKLLMSSCLVSNQITLCFTLLGLCFPYLKDYSPNKLSPKSTSCIFLGYSTLHKGF